MFNFAQSGMAHTFFYRSIPDLVIGVKTIATALKDIHDELERMNDLKEKKMKNAFHILNVKDNPDGTADVTVDLSDEFIGWYIKEYNLEEFDQKHFEEWMIEALIYKLDEEEKNENDKTL